MKVKLLLALFLFVCQLGFSQNEKPIKGKVSSDNILLQNVDVINKTSKKSTVTDENGKFIIEAKANDSLVFYAKEFHLKKIKLSSGQIEQNNLNVIIFKKPEELDEVVVTKLPSIKWKIDKKWEQEKNDQIALENRAKAVKNKTMYDGTIENGMDFVEIAKKIVGLFKREKEPEKETPPKMEFAILAKRVCEEKFYLNTLKLKPEEINLFLQFCEMDPQSKKLISNYNELSMMDFLVEKNGEFQKLKAVK